MANLMRLRGWMRLSCLAVVFSGLVSAPVLADYSAGSETESLMGLSLEELLQVHVTTYSRKPQQLSATLCLSF